MQVAMEWATTNNPEYSLTICTDSQSVVIIHYKMFLPLLLTLLSDNLVLLSPSLTLVTICLPYRIDY